MTQAEQWRDNFLSDQTAYRRAVNRTVVAGAPLTLVTAAALDACNSLVAARALPRRLSEVTSNFMDVTALTPDQSLAFLDATVASVCPDQQSTHVNQVKTAAGQARRRARVQAREDAAEARREAREERRRQQEAEQPQAPPIGYANCTEVEAAGAAPIYAGDPGYSRDLDRDGDGVACEQ